jgi:hypothetical protein
VFAQETAAEIESRWDDLAASLAERFPRAVALIHEAREDVLAFRPFPKEHWKSASASCSLALLKLWRSSGRQARSASGPRLLTPLRRASNGNRRVSTQ